MKIHELETLIPDFLKDSDLLYLCVMDVEGQIFFENQPFSKLYPSASTEVFERNFLDSCSKKNDWDFNDFLMQVVEKPQHKIHIELLHGKSVFVKWEFSVLLNDEDDFAGILAVGHKSAAELGSKDESLGKFSLMESPFGATVTLDFHWEIIHVNAEAEQFFGKKTKEVIGKTIWQVYPDLNVYQHALEFKKAKESKSLRIFEVFNSNNGRFYKVYVYPKTAGLELVFQDVTAIQNLSLELLKSNLKLDAVLEHTEEYVFFVGKDLRIIGFNAKAGHWCNLNLGKNLKEGEKFLGFLSDDLDEIFLKNWENILAGHVVTFEKEITATQMTAGPIWFLHKFFPLRDQLGTVTGFVYSMKDIHSEKLEKDKLKKQNKVMREVLYNQSATLRSPLSSILGLLELIDKNQLDKENKKYLSYLRTLSQDLDKVIRNNSKQISDLD